jgi:hypothetical protein
MGRRPLDLCGVTGKDMYPTKDECRDALAAFGYAKGSRRVYRCPFCDTYHQTKGRRGKPGKGK